MQHLLITGFLGIMTIILLVNMIKIIKEYERAVIFRLGRVLGTPKGPGVFIVIPIIDKIKIIDLRILTLDIPKQGIITRDNVTVDVDAVVYLKVADPLDAVIKVQDYIVASSLLSQTTLRDVIGQCDFDDILSKRDELNKKMKVILDEVTNPWGIKVNSVAIRDVAIPDVMQRAIAKQAEAEREKRSRIIISEGELQAAKNMAKAAESYSKDPAALRLRELQTWAEVAREKNLIIVTEVGNRGTTSDLGTVLGTTKKIQQKSEGKIIEAEKRFKELASDIEKIKDILRSIMERPTS
ncbi:MAG: membrane protease subunit, stomatin/prohibitin-like protein [Thaumarchaeota archaeon]|nr:membrane protease subunit, stomatin/prohibitin-like protein [Nitrososphaerota archaeon]